ncbi:MAG: hypothetical protein ACO38I_09550 [Ilumatobacteraceae bacterium]
MNSPQGSRTVMRPDAWWWEKASRFIQGDIVWAYPKGGLGIVWAYAKGGLGSVLPWPAAVVGATDAAVVVLYYGSVGRDSFEPSEPVLTAFDARTFQEAMLLYKNIPPAWVHALVEAAQDFLRLAQVPLEVKPQWRMTRVLRAVVDAMVKAATCRGPPDPISLMFRALESRVAPYALDWTADGKGVVIREPFDCLSEKILGVTSGAACDAMQEAGFKVTRHETFFMVVFHPNFQRGRNLLRLGRCRVRLASSAWLSVCTFPLCQGFRRGEGCCCPRPGIDFTPAPPGYTASWRDVDEDYKHHLTLRETEAFYFYKMKAIYRDSRLLDCNPKTPKRDCKYLVRHPSQKIGHWAGHSGTCRPSLYFPHYLVCSARSSPKAYFLVHARDVFLNPHPTGRDL